MRVQRRPAWRWLYALVPLMGGLVVVVNRASQVPFAREVMTMGGVVLIYSLAWLWVSANAEALECNDEGREAQDAVDEDEIVSERKLVLPFTSGSAHSEKVLVYAARRNGKPKQ